MAFIVETSITTEGIVPELQIVQSDWILGTLVHGGLGLTDELRNASFKYPYDYILDHIFYKIIINYALIELFVNFCTFWYAF